MGENNCENTILENVAKDLNAGVAAICRWMLNMDASIMQGSEAIILEDNIILLIKDGYGIVYKATRDCYVGKRPIQWLIYCRCCCSDDIKAKLELISKERKIKLIFADSCDRGPSREIFYTLGQIVSLFPEHTLLTFLQTLGFGSAEAEQEVSNYAEYLRDFILKSLSVS